MTKRKAATIFARRSVPIGYAEPGDTIDCGRRRVIDEIYQQFDDDGYWWIEGTDTDGRYFIWKQRFDGGRLEVTR